MAQRDPNEIGALWVKSNARTEYMTGDKFWGKVHRGLGCWEWVGCTNVGGYGVTRHLSRTRLAHRVAWEISRGDIPSGLNVCHRCDNRKCVNPDHLFLGTHGDNNADMRAKGRGVQPPRLNGLRNHNAKLNPDAVCDIRTSALTQIALAEKYGVKQAQISAVRRGKTWRHV